MTTRSAVTEEGREPARVNTEKKKAGTGTWFLPLLLALPFLAALAFAAWKYGPELIRLINVAIKAAVVA